jgi:hypothetical protein
MRIAARTAYLVTTNAVGQRPLLVTTGARQKVAARSSSMKVARSGIAADPAGRVRVVAAEGVATHTPRHMAAVAVLRFMTALAFPGLRAGLDSVPHHEVPAVYLAGLDLLGASCFYGKANAHVVTALAITLGVASLAELLLLHRFTAMMTHETRVVLHETARQDVLEVTSEVAGSAFTFVELLLVLVASETLAHRGNGGLPDLHYARMAGHTLTGDGPHAQVLVVIETDFSVGARRHHVQHLAHAVGIILVTLLTQGGVGQLVGAPFLRW